MVTQYDDRRLLRDMGAAPVVAEVRDRLGPGPGRTVFVGIPAGAAGKDAPGRTARLGYLGAAGPLLELAALSEEPTEAVLLAADGATAAGIEVRIEGRGPGLRLPEPREVGPASSGPAFPMPLSPSSYARSFDARIGLRGMRCPACAAVNFPPRSHCLACRSSGTFEPVDLPRRGRVYTATTVNVPVPGLPDGYGLAVVEVDPGVRVLVRAVADEPDLHIDDEVELVLRKLADREGVPDYAYAARRLPGQGVSRCGP